MEFATEMMLDADNSKLDLSVSDGDSATSRKENIKSQPSIMLLKTGMLPDEEKPQSLTSIESSDQSTAWHYDEVLLVRKHVEKLFKNSTLKDRIHTIPKFAQDECLLGRFLGQGAFGAVHEVIKIITDRNNKTENEWEDDVNHKVAVDEGREFIARHCTLATGEARYAIKRLRTDIIKDSTLYGHGVANMVIEARMLGAIDHPNIIKLHAVADCDRYVQPGFFLVLDLLSDTLEKRLMKWQRMHRQTSSVFRLFDHKGKEKAALLEARLVAASDLSAALAYLHMKGILHRDLKPENIGFDIRGDVKLFDFSMATELHNRTKNHDGTYNLTGMTGSLRYMAPEVALDKPYNASCDVYSFAVLFWEMYALKKPFGLLTSLVFTTFVVNGDMRPPIADTYPTSVKKMLTQCWSKNIDDRLSMKEVTSMLNAEIACLRGCSDTDSI